ncbi:MAG: class I SAM-dependent methyltransferase, partial [Anaerolineales bacterium]
MPLNWIDVTPLSFNTLLLLERAQLSWLPGHAPEGEMAIALRANPAVEWYLRHKCPDLNKWLDEVMSHSHPANSERTRQAEIAIMEKLNDWVVYVVDPVIYDARPFLGWDSNELLSLTDFTGATVIDVGSGTGRLALTVAPIAKTVFAVEPVGNLRRYIKQKARAQGLHNVFSADGLITDIPFPDDFADVTMGGHVYGTYPEREYLE